ncbi:MAG: hypothetical protein GEU92_19895 [Alphaproteobacteria bacterium]|nr:hypothetical protein [Alphaproteobacteria bacterium]
MLPNYDTSPHPVRDDLAEAHRKAWRHIASTGTWLTGRQRVAIAAETRHAANCRLCRDREAALSPYAVEGAHDHLGALPENVVEVIHRVVTDPARLTESWVRKALASGIAEPEYVEIVSIIAHTMCVDTFTDAIGIERHGLPQPEEGEPARVRPDGADYNIAWLPTVPPEQADEDLLAIYPRNVGEAPSAPHVRRALSLVPREAVSFFALNDVQYLPPEAMWNAPINPRSISKSQVELVASRVSALNGCFY